MCYDLCPYMGLKLNRYIRLRKWVRSTHFISIQCNFRFNYLFLMNKMCHTFGYFSIVCALYFSFTSMNENINTRKWQPCHQQYVNHLSIHEHRYIRHSQHIFIVCTQNSLTSHSFRTIETTSTILKINNNNWSHVSLDCRTLFLCGLWINV